MGAAAGGYRGRLGTRGGTTEEVASGLPRLRGPLLHAHAQNVIVCVGEIREKRERPSREGRLWFLRPLYVVVTNTRTRGTPVLHVPGFEPRFTTRTRMYSLTLDKKLEAQGSSVL